MNEFSWETFFSNYNINKMLVYIQQSYKNILSNYIPHETITCHDRDPIWINKNIKQS